MDDEITQSSPSEEPTPTEAPAVAKPSDDEMPTVAIPPLASEEATQTMLTATTLDEMPTQTITPNAPAEAVQVAPVANFVAGMSAPSQPTQTYEQFGTLMAPTQVTPSPEMITFAPQSSGQERYAQNITTPPYANPALYMQNAPYVPQPGQPSFAQPTISAPVPTKRSPLLWMVLIALIAFLLGSGSVFAYTAIQTQAPSPNGTLQKYCDGVKTANAQEIYDTLSQQAKAHASLNDIQRTFDALNFLNSLSTDSSIKYGDCTSSDIHISGTLAVATVTLSLDTTLQGQTSTIASPTLVSLVLENQQWKVDFSNFAQPQPDLSQPSLFSTPTPASN